MVDIDHFKRVNDTFGHQHGDLCLERVAQTIQQNLRAGTDTVARYGGEEFLAILPDATEADALEVAKHVHAEVGRLALPAFEGNLLSISIGLCAMPPGGPAATLNQLLAAADAALYQAKRHGRNQVLAGSVVCDQSSLSASHGELSVVTSAEAARTKASQTVFTAVNMEA